MQKIAPCLWFDDQAEEAAKFYVATFKRRSSVPSPTMERPVRRSQEDRRVR